ncbi:DUF397 domain-containing protein [Streptomyces sp. JV176]|uniref:DUF397 domain-containing protein n=1 Tax=Streptomyces sp. JV176 TaxID=858630 RepID=UPI002E76E35B|nr:DUF397 domain-containing protein [Streptomyces sp. JV176]MEE1797528.1 DUF397 domain-containing protein [Streptomyces sp. JV176]
MPGYSYTDTKTGLTWRKSSYSGGEQGQCVEIAETASAVLVRDSKNPDSSALTVAPAEFAAFTQFVSGVDV